MGAPYPARWVVTESAVARCRRYRRRILAISRQVEAAHVAPAFSCVELVDCLYHDIMREQDVFILSKGHGCLAQYVVLEDLGRLPLGYLDLYCRSGGKLGAHPDYMPEVGIHASTGSLGHGLGIAAGQALAEKLRGSNVRVYVLLSDGECQEGSTWEAAMVAANLQLNNLIALVDANDWGGMDRMSEVHPAMYPIPDKFRAFGWLAGSVMGHDPQHVQHGLAMMRVDGAARPRALVCVTRKGRGVGFIERGLPRWHYRSPTEEEYVVAMRELRDHAPARDCPVAGVAGVVDRCPDVP